MAIENNEHHIQGKKDSVTNNGNSLAFGNSLETIKANYLQECQNSEELRDAHLTEIENKRQELQASKRSKEALIEIEVRDQRDFREQKSAFEQKLNNGPNQDNKNKAHLGSKLKIGILATTLLALLVLLWVVYVSTSFSAFFRTFDQDADAIQVLFSTDSISESFSSTPSAIICNLCVFIFLGLGLILHFLNVSGQRYKWGFMSGIVLVTLFLDSMLAKKIESRICMQTTGASDCNDWSRILVDPDDFLIVIMFSFIVYLIWGILFDIFMGELEKLSPWVQEKRRIRDQIKALDVRIQKAQVSIDGIQPEIIEIEKKIAELLANRNIIQYSKSELRSRAQNYSSGWIEGLAELPFTMAERSQVIESCLTIQSKLFKEWEV